MLTVVSVSSSSSRATSSNSGYSRRSHLGYALHYFLGGFFFSSGVVLWSFLSPFITILFHGGRESWPWFVALWIVLLVLVAVDPTLAARALFLPDSAASCFPV